MGSSFGGIASSLDRRTLPGRVRLAVPPVGVARLHRHRHRPRWRPGFDPVVKFVNRYRAKPQPARGPHLHDLRHLRAADHPQPVDGAGVPGAPAWTCNYRRRATGTTGRTGATGCGTACPGFTRATRSSSTSRARRGSGAVKVTERWYSDRMEPRDHPGPVGPLRRPGAALPDRRWRRGGGRATPHDRTTWRRCSTRAGSRSTRATASPAARWPARTARREYRCRSSTSSTQAMAHEVVPAIHADCGGPPAVIVAGASIGAFNALALICRYPHLFDAAVCMSGTYDIEQFIGGPFTDDLYFASPLALPPRPRGPAARAAPAAASSPRVRKRRVGGRR